MRTVNTVLCCTLALGLTAGTSVASDLLRGRLLYENHCTECHEPHVHERGLSKLRTAGEVRHYVDRWQQELKLDWSREEVEDVTDYLGRQYYEFIE